MSRYNVWRTVKPEPERSKTTIVIEINLHEENTEGLLLHTPESMVGMLAEDIAEAVRDLRVAIDKHRGGH